MRQSFWRTGLSGLLASFVFSQLSGLTFYEIGVRSGILFNPAYQSPKVLAVVPTMVMVKAPYIIYVGWTVILIGYAFLFSHISVLWPQGYWRRLWRLGSLIWFFSLLFFEFQGPYNLLREPVPLLLLELLFWMICAFGAAAVIVAMNRSRKAVSAPVEASGARRFALGIRSGAQRPPEYWAESSFPSLPC